MPSFLDRLFGRHQADHQGDDHQDDEREHPVGDRRYLEFVGGTSAKFYAAVLHATDEDAWTVSFNFGRIGHPRDWATKIDDADEDEAREVFDALIEDKVRGGYVIKQWPSDLEGPDGIASDEGHDARGTSLREPAAALAAGPPLYVAAAPGALPPAIGAQVAGIALPDGVLVSQDGDDTAPPVIWISARPVERIEDQWRRLAAAFADTGLWPLIMELEVEPAGMGEMLVDQVSPEGGGAQAILGRWWSESVGDGDEFDREGVAPLGRRFPGLADPTPGERPANLDGHIRGMSGHLGLVAARRPADVLAATGWIGAANFDMDPGDQSTVLRSWEDRFDAYVVGLGWSILTVAVGRPPRTVAAATGIAAEHLAFCPDNIWQGVGTIRDYRESLVDAPTWPFWWD